LKKTNIPLDILLVSFCIVALILWLCKETLNIYAAHFANLALFASILILVYGGLVGFHRLAMMRLEYLKEKSAQRFTATLNAGQSLVVIDGDNQTLVTAPTAKQLPAAEPVAALPAPVEMYFDQQPILNYGELADGLINATNQTTLLLGTTGTSKTTTAFNILLAMDTAYKVVFFTLKGGEYSTPLGDDYTNLKNYLQQIKNQVEQGTFINDELLVVMVDEAKSILESKDDKLIALLKYAISVLREYNVVVWFLGQGKNVGSFKGMNGDDFLNCSYIMLGWPVIGGYSNSVLCDNQNRKQANEEIKAMQQHGYSPVIFGAYNPNERTKPILSSIPHGDGVIDWASIQWADVELLVDDMIEDYPPTFQSETNFSLNRTLNQHDRLVTILLAAYPDGELPQTKKEIHNLVGLSQDGGNVKAVNLAIEKFNELTN